MKKIGAIFLSVVLLVSLGGCSINISNIIHTKKISFKKDGYVGKYSMVGALKISNEEFEELIESTKGDTLEYQRAFDLKKDGMSFEDLEINAELLCIEIRDTKDVIICIGGLQKENAKLVTEGKKTYIELEKNLIKNLGNKILLGEKEIDNKHYLTFEVGKNKRVYFEQLKNKNTASIIEVISDGTFELNGVFEIDRKVEEQETGYDMVYMWGTSINIYGSQMTVNSDGTGNYRIGNAEKEEFKIVEEDKDTYMELTKENGYDDGKYLIELREIDGETYVYVNKGYGQYWKMLEKDAVVFDIPNEGVYIWH